MNFFAGLVVTVFSLFIFFSRLLQLQVNDTIISGYCVIFAGILTLYELHLKKLNRRFRLEYGFLFTYIGRACYVFLYLFSSCMTLVLLRFFCPCGISSRSSSLWYFLPSLWWTSVWLSSTRRSTDVNWPSSTTQQSVIRLAITCERHSIMMCRRLRTIWWRILNLLRRCLLEQLSCLYNSLFVKMSREAFALPKYYNTNIDYESEPQSAIEYLIRVHQEAETIPNVYSIPNRNVAFWIDYNVDGCGGKGKGIHWPNWWGTLIFFQLMSRRRCL